MGACRECSGPLKGDERWCPRCHVQVLTPEEEEATIGSLFGAIHEGHIEARKTPWQAHEVHFRPRMEQRYSRFRGGALGFGPGTRAAITVLVMMPALFFGQAIVTVEGPMRAFPFVLLGGYLFSALQILRAIWAKGPVE